MKRVFVGVFLILAVLLYGCGHIEEKYVASEDDLNDIFDLLEKIEDKVDSMVEKGHATKEELVELQDDIDVLRSAMEYDFSDEDYDETLFLR